MIRFARVVHVIGNAPNGKFDAKLVKLSISGSINEVSAYAKKLSDLEFLVEIVTATIGRELGLPIPEPIIAFSTDGNDILFASVDAKHPDLTRQLTITNHQTVANTPENMEIMQLLSNWEYISLAISFDEWIANGDRNTGNILFDGENIFTLIDHNLAMRLPFSPSSPVQNMLMNIKLSFTQDEVAKQRLRNNIQKIIHDIDKQLPRLATKDLAEQIKDIDSQLISDMIHFLEHRLGFLTSITLGKIPVKQLSL